MCKDQGALRDLRLLWPQLLAEMEALRATNGSLESDLAAARGKLQEADGAASETAAALEALKKELDDARWVQHGQMRQEDAALCIGIASGVRRQPAAARRPSLWTPSLLFLQCQHPTGRHVSCAIR